MAKSDDAKFRKGVGRRLRAARLATGLKTTDVGSLLSVSERNVTSWETGVKAPSVRNLMSMATMYAVSVDHLLANFPPSDSGSESVTVSRLRGELEHERQENASLHEMNAYLSRKLTDRDQAENATQIRRASARFVEYPEDIPSEVDEMNQRRKVAGLVCGVKHWRRDTRCVFPAAVHTGPHDDGEGLRWTNERMSYSP